MAMLFAFYGQGKSYDAHSMTEGWNYIIGEYDYETAKRALIKYVKNDTREYATFPTAGLIRKAIEEEMSMPRRIFNKIHRGLPYESLSVDEKRYIGEKAYQKAIEMKVEDLLDAGEKIIGYMQERQKKLGG